ncbi:hypothetical protein FPJ27_20850 [Burkholderia sp. MS455]|uniref:Uncharacterized protein n=1 Tax=Burkholderia pyrrocinia TaxID=60550 RepID=A0A318IBW6_BURPY|nr:MULTISPECIES: hypothetical protein [Burkholderia]PXX27177.1 hypothetical protein NA66_102165 [Burkholderia pyrrocinia]QRR08782.1 hypothetical protein FPJ27_20850 [Burkholderia sp. MS455]SFW81786.1 hypothetical protein SAMN03159384_05495 [Burkholderia sp. NFACC33-1]SFY43645.1 hypothetical protein SAMN03159408_05584 [Burkholderia sp. NFPP32]
MQTVSVRIPEDDLAWLVELQLPDATSPSDKIRALIADARRRGRGAHDFVRCAALFREQVRPVLDAIDAYEHATHQRSEIVTLLAAQLPELMASLVTAAPPGKPIAEAAGELEARLTAKSMRLLLGMLRLAVTGNPPVYQPAVLDSYVHEVKELANLIQPAQANP